jgi:hypothetical protein
MQPPGSRVLTAQDLQLNCGVRSVLNRHWIDLTKTAFFARSGHVHLSGEVSVIGATRRHANTADVLRAFEAELRRLQEVKSVSFEFTNWIRDDAGFWVCLDKTTPLPPSQPTRGDNEGEIFDLEAGDGND